MTPRGVGALLAVCLLVLGTTAAACSVAGPQQVVVSAAASLTEAFDELERTYEDDNPDVDIVLNLGGSQILAGQIVDGAPADLFASANPQSVRLVADAGLGQGDPIVLATNRLVIVVPAGNPQARLRRWATSSSSMSCSVRRRCPSAPTPRRRSTPPG